MNRRILLILSLLAMTLCMSAKRVGAYCYFANNGSQLFEDENVKVVLAMEGDMLKLAIYNKTYQPIYVDKEKSFAFTNGVSNTLSHNVNNLASNDLNSNSGGLASAFGFNTPTQNFGNGELLVPGTEAYINRVVVVEPQSFSVLHTWKDPRDLFLERFTEKTKTKDFNKRGRFVDPMTGQTEKFEKGFGRSYTENETPFSVKGILTYSTEANFASVNNAEVSDFVSDIIIDSYKGVKDASYALPYCQQMKGRRADYSFVSGPPFATTPGGLLLIILVTEVVVLGTVLPIALAGS